MKIDLTKVHVTDVEGKDVVINLAQHLGNAMYMQGGSLPECELGRELYHSQGEIEVNAEQAEIIRRFALPLPYVTRTAVQKLLTEQ